MVILVSVASEASQAPEREGTVWQPSGKGYSASNVGPSTIAQGDADALAAALDIPAGLIVSASLGDTDVRAAAVSDAPVGGLFPTQGATFVILASGAAEAADDSNGSGSLGLQLDGLNNVNGTDMAQLVLELNVPAGSECVSFDFAFYSEEFPELVGSAFNDAFTAEYPSSDLSIVNGNEVVAPNNFAFDSEGNIISVNTVFGVTENTGTTYDGATPRIRAFTPLDAGMSTATLTFSIQDVGDSGWDSAVFLDNLGFGSGVGCDAGAFVDSDNDGLLDDWETNGIDVDGDGTVDLWLQDMGADPQRKDIFVEVDYMADNSVGGKNLKPNQTAIDMVVAAFAAAPVANPDGSTGITLHVDNGPDSTMIPAVNGTPAQTWGAMSAQTVLPYQETIGSSNEATGYNWSEFDVLRNTNFPINRRDVFHYNVWANKLGGRDTTSGIARGIPSGDFFVTLGGWLVPGGTVNQQAGTFMHELGHNLGLRHGGSDGANNKPNYLSVMNYSFQTRGLRMNDVDGNFDYSRFDLPDLDETNLDENAGLGGPAESDSYGTLWCCNPTGTNEFFCGDGSTRIDNAGNAPLDWDCDGSATGTGLSADINDTGSQTTLTSQNDWDEIDYTGGQVGALGQNVTLPEETDADEINKTLDEALPTEFGVEVSATSSFVATGTVASTVGFTVHNPSSATASYVLDPVVISGTVDTSSVPSSVNLDPGASISYTLPVTVQAASGEDAQVSLTATDNDNEIIADQGSASVLVFNAQILDSKLPTSRSVNLGDMATVFAMVANAGPDDALGVGFELITAIPATLGYQTTDPATNALTGSPNTPVDIASGGSQSFVLSITPTAVFAPRDVEFSVTSTNALPASVVPGLNTVLLSASTTPVPDIIVLSATPSGDGIVRIPGTDGSAAFAAATFNLGAADDIEVSANTGDAVLPIVLNVCETDALGACLAGPASTVTTNIANGASPTFSIFVTATGAIPFLPAVNRLNVIYKDSGGDIRGSSSTAVQTQQGDLVCSAWLSPVAVSEVEDATLEEISGLVISQINPGILWVLEDSGADPVLTALGMDGSVHGTLRLSGVANRDWEDLASGPCGEQTCLFVGEFGDNGAVRTDASIMRVEEPLLDGAVGFSLSVEPRVYPFTYPEGPQDAEALVVEPDGTSVVLTKRSDGTARAYRLPLVVDVSVEAVLLGEIALGTGEGLANMATAADIWPDGTQMIVRTYTGAWVFSLADGGVADAVSAAGSEVTTGLEMQGEAMAYDAADGSIWHVSEGVNPTLFRLPCQD